MSEDRPPHQADEDALTRASEAIEYHWNEILRLKRQVYDELLHSRKRARSAELIMRRIDQLTEPTIRVQPPRLEAVPTVPGEDGSRR